MKNNEQTGSVWRVIIEDEVIRRQLPITHNNVIESKQLHLPLFIIKFCALFFLIPLVFLVHQV